jgi:hypothetical protein
MFDTDKPAAVPASARAVCLYGDGDAGSATSADWTRFGRGVRLVVAVRRLVAVAPRYPGGAVVGDFETGALTLAQLPHWVTMQRQVGPPARVGIYIAFSRWSSAKLAARNAGITDLDWWVADWLEGDTPPEHEQPTAPLTGSVAWQYASTATSGGHYDLSVTSPTWPPAPPGTQEEADMQWGIQQTGDGQVAVIPRTPEGGNSALVKAPITTASDLAALEKMGAVAVGFSTSTLAAMPTVSLVPPPAPPAAETVTAGPEEHTTTISGGDVSVAPAGSSPEVGGEQVGLDSAPPPSGPGQ